MKFDKLLSIVDPALGHSRGHHLAALSCLVDELSVENTDNSNISRYREEVFGSVKNWLLTLAKRGKDEE